MPLGDASFEARLAGALALPAAGFPPSMSSQLGLMDRLALTASFWLSVYRELPLESQVSRQYDADESIENVIKMGDVLAPVAELVAKVSTSPVFCHLRLLQAFSRGRNCGCEGFVRCSPTDYGLVGRLVSLEFFWIW
jgi:hypothetical protein